ncbi:MAG: hypothetical protein J5895_00950 [Alphaproteobacteria bacterium]|nr:hypothetical protein [Alphaproteobacteria bacterium]
MANTFQRVEKAAVGGAYLGAGVSLKLAEFGLSAGQVVASGAKNLADEFVKAPDIKVAEPVLNDVKKATGKAAAWLIKQGKSY